MELQSGHIISHGEFYGYPPCCISSFHKVLLGEKPVNTLQLQAGRGTGFVPCLDHAKQIQAGEVKLENVILPSRLCKGKFPNGYQIKAKVVEDLNKSHQEEPRNDNHQTPCDCPQSRIQ